jgi:HAD superfamily hydrolase (TIGR01548 family)
LVIPAPPDVLVFDMDGVLVEVGESYREAIRETVRHFTGELVSHDLIQDFKNQGGWNNDWLLSHRFILDRGVKVDYVDVVDYFNRIFLGENGDGLIQRERWMPSTDLFARLSQRAILAIFTGRAKYEADATLRRHADSVLFDPIITDELVANPKPAPDGLELIKQRYPEKQLWYLGDTVDDARSSRSANVPFVGVSMKANPRYAEINQTLYDGGAFAVIENVNELESLLDEAKKKQ